MDLRERAQGPFRPAQYLATLGGMTDTSPSSVRSVPDHPTVLAAMRMASRAPSLHNTQPWRWIFDGVRLHLYRDDDRLLTSADPLGRQLVISCGAMLHHVRT